MYLMSYQKNCPRPGHNATRSALPIGGVALIEHVRRGLKLGQALELYVSWTLPEIYRSLVLPNPPAVRRGPAGGGSPSSGSRACPC
jgi:hypothetical protein